MPQKHLNRRDFLRTAAAGGAAAALGAPASWAQQGRRQPNVLFFLVDDLGWLDTESYGSAYYDTPNVGRLARQSVRFTSAYAANPLCSPTRASIITGKYPARLGLTAPAGHLPPLDTPLVPEEGPPHMEWLIPRSKRFLPLEERTLAEAMKDAGYHTGFIGKWHLGHPDKYWPEQQGFDVNIGGGMWPGPPSYHAPYHITAMEEGPEGEYLADRLTDETLAYLDDHADDPFFLCLWHYSVHAPYQAKEELIDDFRGETDPRGEQNNPIMAAMIKSMDESLGRVLDKLEQLGIADDTVIIFFSDNGGNEYDRVGEERWLPTNNDPLRSGKGAIYEGGVRVPMFVYWPGVTEAGTECDELVSSVDFYPTLAEMAGFEPAPGKVLDGVSITPLLRGAEELDREAIFCHMPHRVDSPTGLLGMPATAVWRGDWKLIRFWVTNEEFPNEFELYNLAEDIGETNNLADERPQLVRELNALIEIHIEEVDAILPKRNPRYDPEALERAEGWIASWHASLQLEDGAMRINSSGHDPVVYTNQVPGAEGPLTMRFRMKSNAAGAGHAYWSTTRQRAFNRQRRLDVNPVHDGAWREYAVSFTADTPLHGLRIDPASAEGTIYIDWIRLETPTGEVLKTWKFEGAG